ncbi:TonB-dependent receptor, partial [Nitrosomonas europaea]|uniref:TonB-dependent receptor n=1 Tax=Nitrosomonas europaea TaxID=915 RepID=UPI0023F3913C
MITCILASLTGAVVIPNSVMAAEALDNTAQRDYAIPASQLGDALAQFAAASGVPLSFDPQMLSGLSSKGLQGRYTVRAGFSRLLAGSGYELVEAGNGGYSLHRIAAAGGPVTLPPLTVSTASLKQGTAEEGYRVSNISGIGLWGERSLRDTPYSMSIVPSDLIENVNAQNMGQIFKMNPLTQEPMIQNFTGTPHVTIRGFPTLNPIYDGIPMAGVNGSAVSVIEIDRVEILSGTSGFLYGGGRVGGAINYVTKSPTNVPLRRLTFGNYGGTQFYGHADIGG